MKKYLVIGNPIEHSLSPKLHNYWIKENNIDAVYDKKQLNETDVKRIISEVKDGKIVGLAHYRKLLSPLKGKYIGYLDDIFVDPEYRGQKIGAKLLNKIKEDRKSVV